MAGKGDGGAKTALEFSRPRMSHILIRERDHKFDESADAQEQAALADLFGAISVDKFRFAGTVTVTPEEGLILNARVQATVIQRCVVSLQPVPAKIDERVRRYYDPALDPEQVDFSADEDEEVEALPRTLDLGLVAIEAAALALPPYPRADGAEIAQADDEVPEDDAEERKPFAALAALREKMGDGEG